MIIAHNIANNVIILTLLMSEFIVRMYVCLIGGVCMVRAYVNVFETAMLSSDKY